MRLKRRFPAVFASKILDRPSGDPDDDLGILARQLLRADERMREAEGLIGGILSRHGDYINSLPGESGVSDLRRARVFLSPGKP